MAKIEMKMAKADKEDIDRITDFFLMLEGILEYRCYTTPDGTSIENPTEEQTVSLIRQAWGRVGPGVGPSWRRVVMGCAVLIDNACDPNADTLEWRPDIAAFLESRESVSVDSVPCPA